VNDSGGSVLSRLLDAALELPAAARAAWLDELGASHDELKPRLRALLARAAEVESRDFLGTLPPLPGDDEPAETGPGESAGMRIGPYRLERPLGAGGMGTVWLASQADGLFERQVALKLPHRGMFGAGLAERMARERAILAALEHPHIARLYGAGLTEDGQPWLALEYVEGVPIDEYCRTRRLELRERVRLFVQVADAVAAAHARLVVHRDLKPANILVTSEGYVRLLDFGIAKLLDSADESRSAGLTQLSVHALTPDYASPEQIRGESVTIASDIYSLGVVLYELLAGERPYRLKRDTRGALEDAILDTQPRRPSDVSGERAQRGDLDTIVLKALHKLPAERYATANAFVDDLRLYLAGRPVHARPDSGWYRASRFLRRHALGSSIAAAVTIAIVSAAGIAFWQAHVANAERQRAEDVSRFIKSIFTDADPFAGGGRELRALELLKQARTRVDTELADRPAQRVEMLNTIALSLCHLSDPEGADEVSKSALALAMTLPADSPERREARMVRLEVHRTLNENEPLRRETDELLAESARIPSFTATDRIRLLSYSAHAAIDEGDHARAVREATEGFELASRTLPELDPLQVELGAIQAVALRYAGETMRALDASERNLQRALAAAHGNASDARVLDARMGLGSIYNDVGRHEDAVRELEAAARGAPALYGANNSFEMFARSHLARALSEAGNHARALAEIERTLAIAAAQPDGESRNSGIATGIRAHILLALGRFPEALRDFDVALAFYTQNYGADHYATAGLRIDRALALAHLGRHDEALAELEPLAATWKEIKHWMVLSPGYALGVAQRLSGDARAGLSTLKAALAAVPEGPRQARVLDAIHAEIERCASALAPAGA
jgi:eukaryotic-like serine/threonine-protein kinase